MEKPLNLPKQTDRDHDYLVRHGWRYIGRERYQYGWIYFWDYYMGDPTQGEGCWSNAYTQGNALMKCRRLLKLSARFGS